MCYAEQYASAHENARELDQPLCSVCAADTLDCIKVTRIPTCKFSVNLVAIPHGETGKQCCRQVLVHVGGTASVFLQGWLNWRLVHVSLVEPKKRTI